MTTSITLTANKLSGMFSIIFFLLSLALYAQEKETIYIEYNKEREISDSLGEVGFGIRPQYFFSSYQFDDFIYKKNKHEKLKISYLDMKDKLISKEEANKKVDEYLEKSAKKR